jgi:spermidine/putrescine-binding protein
MEQLFAEARRSGLTRRGVLKRGLALGLSVPAIKGVLATGAFAQDTPMSPAANGPVDVPIVGKSMSLDDIKAAIRDEGEVTVGNWTYSANDQLTQQFQNYVEAVYGESITLNYVGSQSPTTYLTELYTAVGADDDSPYDVMAIEENYWAEAQAQATAQNLKLMEDYLPSGLIPNADRVLDNFKRGATAVGFQASATPGIVYNKNQVDFLTDWSDLADERLKGKILGFLPGDITSGAILLGLADSLGKDVSDPAQATEVINYWVEKIHPNVVQYTTDNATIQSLFASGEVSVVTFWNSMARFHYLNGMAESAFLVAKSGQYAINGYNWIPAKAKHPVLAQIFIDWRLSDDAQFPDLETWGITEGAWSELHEGFMGESYVELVPEWIKDVYYTYFPTIEQLSTQYKSPDWSVYTANSAAWFDEWNQGLGL